MKSIKTVLATLAVAAFAASAMAVQTQQLWIDDNGVPIAVTATTTSGTLTLTGSDAYWSVVATIGTASPPLAGGTLSSPVLDLSVSAISLAGSAGHNVTISFAADGYGPTAAGFAALFTGHVTSGTGQSVGFNTYYNTANTRVDNPSTTLLTTTTMTGPSYSSLTTSSPLSLASPYSLTEVITLQGAAVGGGYSLDGSLLTVPDGGTTAMLLGAALSVIGLIRRKIA